MKDKVNRNSWSCEEHQSCRVLAVKSNKPIGPVVYPNMMYAIRALDPFQSESRPIAKLYLDEPKSGT